MATDDELAECRQLLERIVESCESGDLEASIAVVTGLRGALEMLAALDSVQDTTV